MIKFLVVALALALLAQNANAIHVNPFHRQHLDKEIARFLFLIFILLLLLLLLLLLFLIFVF